MVSVLSDEIIEARRLKALRSGQEALSPRHSPSGVSTKSNSTVDHVAAPDVSGNSQGLTPDDFEAAQILVLMSKGLVGRKHVVPTIEKPGSEAVADKHAEGEFKGPAKRDSKSLPRLRLRNQELLAAMGDASD